MCGLCCYFDHLWTIWALVVIVTSLSFYLFFLGKFRLWFRSLILKTKFSITLGITFVIEVMIIIDHLFEILSIKQVASRYKLHGFLLSAIIGLCSGIFLIFFLFYLSFLFFILFMNWFIINWLCNWLLNLLCLCVIFNRVELLISVRLAWHSG